MAETFYGPWDVVVTHADFARFSFVISGSADADGRYVVDPDQPPEVAVSGEEWTIEVEVRWFSDDPTWRPTEILQRMTAFVPFRGLTVVLDSRPPKPPGFIGPVQHGVVLTCTSTDPEANPIPATALPDFTIPGR